jgi:hypothetical protein
MNWQTILGQVERMSSKRITMGETCSSRPFAKMVEKFKQKQGHDMGNRKVHKNKSNTLT